MLIRFFPKHKDFSKFIRNDIRQVQKLINERPGKHVIVNTKEMFKELLLR